MIDFKDIRFAYEKKPIFDGLFGCAAKGKLTGVIGPNGCGKTTLIKILAGLLKISNGEILLQGKPLVSYGAKALSKVRAYLPQERILHWPFTVKEVIGLGRLEPRPPDYFTDAELRLINSLDIGDLLKKCFHELSGGERAMVLFARAMISHPEILLADEPTASLDPKNSLDVMKAIGRFCAAGGTAIVVFHDLNLALQFCDEIILLQEGRIVAAGEASRVMTEDNLSRVFNVAFRTVRTEDHAVLAIDSKAKGHEIA